MKKMEELLADHYLADFKYKKRTLKSFWHSCDKTSEFYWAFWMLNKKNNKISIKNRKLLILVACECIKLFFKHKSLDIAIDYALGKTTLSKVERNIISIEESLDSSKKRILRLATNCKEFLGENWRALRWVVDYYSSELFCDNFHLCQTFGATYLPKKRNR